MFMDGAGITKFYCTQEKAYYAQVAKVFSDPENQDPVKVRALTRLLNAHTVAINEFHKKISEAKKASAVTATVWQDVHDEVLAGKNELARFLGTHELRKKSANERVDVAIQKLAKYCLAAQEEL